MTKDTDRSGGRSRKVDESSASSLGTSLAILRAVRGWSQEQLSEASGVRAGTISDYERGKMTPGLNSLTRLLEAMGYPLAALEATQSFVESVVATTARHLEIPLPTKNLQAEIAAATAEAGRVATRLTRLFLLLASQHEPPKRASPPSS